jgi:hypothetical protein
MVNPKGGGVMSQSLSPAEKVLLEQANEHFANGLYADIYEHDVAKGWAQYRIRRVFEEAAEELYGKLCAIEFNKSQ